MYLLLPLEKKHGVLPLSGAKEPDGFPTESLSSRAKWFPLLISVSLAPTALAPYMYVNMYTYTYTHIHTTTLNTWPNILHTYILTCPGRQKRSILWKVNSCISWLGPTLLSQLIVGDYVLISTLRLQKEKGQLAWDPLYSCYRWLWKNLIYQAFPRSYKTRERETCEWDIESSKLVEVREQISLLTDPEH